MKKIVKLDKYDIDHLLRVILEQDDERGTPIGEFADTKAELVRQAKDNINNMILSKNSGTLVSFMIQLFNEDPIQKGLELIGITLNNFLEGGGKEVDFNRQMTAKIKPYFKNVVESIEEIASATLKEKGIDDADEDDYNNEQPDTKSRSDLKKSAQQIIANLSGNQATMRAFSVILLYLTDRDTKADLDRYGQVYGKTINKIADDYELQDAFKAKLYTPLYKFFKVLAESLNEDIKKTSSETKQTTQFKQDKAKIEAIAKKYP